jgi:hypothetical protein
MAKTFKKFREDYDEEWGSGDDEVHDKEHRMKQRRDRKRMKRQQKNENLSVKNDD